MSLRRWQRRGRGVVIGRQPATRKVCWRKVAESRLRHSGLASDRAECGRLRRWIGKSKFQESGGRRAMLQAATVELAQTASFATFNGDALTVLLAGLAANS